MKNKPAAEFVSYMLKPGVDREVFLNSARESQQVLQRFDGFMNRSLYQDIEHQTWIDLVHWNNLPAAAKAAEMFMQDPDAAAFIEYLDQNTVVMHHFEWREELSTSTTLSVPVSSANCIEFLIYKLKAGAGRERYENVLAEIRETICKFDAFLRRDIYFDASSEQWLEVVYYRDQPSAYAMFGEIKDEACMLACMELIDETSLTMIFAEPANLTN